MAHEIGDDDRTGEPAVKAEIEMENGRAKFKVEEVHDLECPNCGGNAHYDGKYGWCEDCDAEVVNRDDE